VKFEPTDQTRAAVDHYLRAAGNKPRGSPRDFLGIEVDDALAIAEQIDV
jgi:hypothetical protein